MIEFIYITLLGIIVLFLIINYGLKRINFKNKIHKKRKLQKNKESDDCDSFSDFGSD